VDSLFAHAGGSAVGLFSGSLLVFSGVSLTRRMQRMYQQAWRLEARRGVGHAVHAALGLTTLLLGISLLYLARALIGSLLSSQVLLLAVSAVAGLLLWSCLPWVLLDRRIAWRRLVPTGVLTSVCTSAYGIASTVYMPRLLETYSRRYGLFGVTLALVGWLLAIAFTVVAATTVATEFDRAPDPWARRLRGRFRIEGAPAEVEFPEAGNHRPLPLPAAPGQPQAAAPPTPVDPTSGPAAPRSGRVRRASDARRRASPR
jgi:uncharacterized BrkB/YihY/UPF0761 family membrane protein